MRLCDVGAARTELGVISLTSTLAGAEVGSASFGTEAFSYALWGMALNNFGWLFLVFILGHRMSGVVEKMNTKYNPVWVKKLLAGATVGLFAYLLANQIQDLQMPKLTPAIISGYAAVDHSVEKISKTPGIGAWYIHAGGDDCHSDSIWIN